MSRKSLVLAVAAALSLSGICSGPAIAAGGSFQIGLQVAASCFVTPSSPVSVSDGGASTGSVVEACNSGGYTVTANYRGLAAGEGATLQYDGQTIVLPAGGQVTVHVSDMANIAQVAYALQPQHLDSPLQVTFQVTPA